MKKHTVLRAVPSLMLAGTLLASNVLIVDAAHGQHGISGHSSNVSSEAKPYSIPDKATYKSIEDIKSTNLKNKTAIIMTNDTHGAIDGFAYIPPLESLLADKGAEVVTVDCGDFSQSRTSKDYVKKSKGISAIKIMNAAGYDVGALGNHEFDFRYNDSECALSDRLHYAEFPLICANAIVNETKEPLVQPNYVYQTKNGMNIGFFGLDTGETQESGHDSSGKTDGITFLTGTTAINKYNDDHYDIYDCALDQVKDLKNADDERNKPEDPALNNPKADIVLCLAHLGIEDSDKRLAAGDRSYEVLRKVNTEDNKDNRIDFLLDANSHDIMTTDSDNNPIMSTGYIFQNIGVIIIDNESHQVVDHYLIQEKDYKNLTPDKNVLSVIQEAKDKKFDDLDKKIEEEDVKDEESLEDESIDEQNADTPEVEDQNTDEQSTLDDSVEETPEDDVVVEDDSEDDQNIEDNDDNDDHHQKDHDKKHKYKDKHDHNKHHHH